MRVAIASLGPDLDSPVATMFGRAPYFIIADLDTGDWSAEPNPAATAPQAAGVQAAQFIASKGVKVVALAGYVGPNSQYILGSSGVEVRAVPPVKVREAIEILKGKAPAPGDVSSELAELRKMLEELERKIEELEKRLS